MLLHDFFNNNTLTLRDKYNMLRNTYNQGGTYVIMNNVSVFGPFQREKNWNISEEERTAIYNKDVVKVLNWVKINILLNLGQHSSYTNDVLLRIATGMINKLPITEELKQFYHDNMTRNVQCEFYKIMTEDLPF